MSDNNNPETQSSEAVSSLRDRFYVGGEDLLGSVEAIETLFETEKKDESPNDIVSEIRIRIGTLLKTENMSVLFGAGASKDCGGLLIGSIPLEIERALHESGIRGTSRQTIRKWLKIFYLAAERSGDGEGVPTNRSDIMQRGKDVADNSARPLRANLEAVLGLLHRWLSIMDESNPRFRLEGTSVVDISRNDTAECIALLTAALAQLCVLPADGKESCLSTYSDFLRKALTRPLNLRRVNIFTLNYDTLVEKASDGEGIVLLDGFIGTNTRIFRPECYDQDMYFPAETTEGRVHRFDRVLHLYKLHGSITWRVKEATIENPYGVESATSYDSKATSVLVYPTPLKYTETLGMPYAELFRRFATAIVRPQSVLFVIGYGFGDDHVNAIIRQALALPSFTLVIVDPSPQSQFVRKLRSQDDRRVWIIEGSKIGKFGGFTSKIMPDLRDEDIQRKVQETQRALKSTGRDNKEALDAQ